MQSLPLLLRMHSPAPFAAKRSKRRFTYFFSKFQFKRSVIHHTAYLVYSQVTYTVIIQYCRVPSGTIRRTEKKRRKRRKGCHNNGLTMLFLFSTVQIIRLGRITQVTNGRRTLKLQNNLRRVKNLASTCQFIKQLET